MDEVLYVVRLQGLVSFGKARRYDDLSGNANQLGVDLACNQLDGYGDEFE